ncbi:MAG: SBBP repeat-containing protein [Bacteroidia bacterium]
MKKIFTLIIIATLFSIKAYSQSYIFANSVGSTNYESAQAIAKDNSGNLYVTGYFGDSVYFGATKLKSAGSKDIFICKYTPSGSVVWAKRFGGNYNDQGFAIALDNAGNIYLTGVISSDTAFFDTVKVNCSSQQIFAAKFNSSGNCIWAKEFGDETKSDDTGWGIGVDGSGNVYLTGWYSGVAVFAPGITLSSVIHPLYLTGTVDMFTAKLNSSGICQWANTAGSYGEERGYSVAVEPNGTCYVAGYFTRTTIFNGVSVTCASGGVPDGFVAVYDNNGNLTQLKTITGTDYEACYGITLDGLGNYYITGLKRATGSFDTISVPGYGDFDMFLAKYSTSGNVKWVRTTQGSQWEEGSCVRCDDHGDPYVSGDYYFNGTTPFPPNPFPGLGYDAMVAKYNKNGEFQWAQHGGSSGGDYCPGLAITDSGKVYICGNFANSATFGNFSLTLTGSPGSTDLFFAKLRTNINTGNPTGTTFCGGVTITIPYVANITFKPANTFTAQLSDANGKFANAVNIGTLASTTSGSISATIPFNTVTGTGYRVRVIASDTVATGDDNGIDLTINAAPSVHLTANDSAICIGDSALLSTPNTAGNNYKWYFNNVLINGAASSQYYAKQTGTYKVRVTNASGCSQTSTNLVITVNNYPSALVTASGPLTFCTGDSVILTASAGVGYTYQWKKGTSLIAGASQNKYKATKSGTYKVIVTNGAGCSVTSGTKKVVVYTPVATISCDSVTFCAGDSLKLQANVNSSYTYQWKKGTGNVANGVNPTLYAKTGGTYKVVVTDTNGCSVTSNKLIIYVVSCRQAVINTETIFSISPNPSATGKFNLIADEEIKEYSIMDITGRILFSKSVASDQFEIDLSDYNDGFYFLNIKSGDKIISAKLIKLAE